MKEHTSLKTFNIHTEELREVCGKWNKKFILMQKKNEIHAQLRHNTHFPQTFKKHLSELI